MILDNIDKQLLKLLQEDGRTPFREIASKLGVAEGTIYNRLDRLKGAQILKGFTTRLNPEALGFDLSAIIGIKLKGGHSKNVEQEIAKMPEVLSIYDVTGEYDSLLLVRTRSRKDLNTFVKRLQKISSIDRTHTQVVLNTIKETLKLDL